MTSLRNHLPTIVSTIVAVVVTFGVSYYFYHAGSPQRVPIFQSSEYSLLADPDQIGGQLNITRKDGKPISNKVWAVNFFFWNAGHMEIRKDDLLKPLTLQVSEHAEILDYQLTNQSRPEIVNGSLEVAGPTSIRLSFDILEHHDGIAGQFILEGDNPNIQLDGAILSVKEISDQPPADIAAGLWKAVFFPASILLGVIFAGGIILILTIEIFPRVSRWIYKRFLDEERYERHAKIVPVILTTLFIGSIITIFGIATFYSVQRAAIPDPPITAFER